MTGQVGSYQVITVVQEVQEKLHTMEEDYP